MSCVDVAPGREPGAVSSWTPSRLIEVFCARGLRSGSRAAGRNPNARSEWHAGSCAYAGKNAYGPGIDGFDDGICLWEDLERSGWSLIQDPGDRQFPYAQYLTWRPTREARPDSPEARWCMAHFREGDLRVEVYDDEDSYLDGELAIRKFDGWRPRAVPEDAQLIRAAHSEVCMYMRCAGEIMWAAPLEAEHGEGQPMAQLYTLEGKTFSMPILRSEAGLSKPRSSRETTEPRSWARATLF